MAKAQNKTHKKNSRSALLMVGFLGVMFATPTAILILGGMIPAYGSFLLDREKGKLTTITVAALNFAALTPLLVQLWSSNHTVSNAFNMLFSPFAWLLMLAGAGVGWVLAQVIPAIIVMVIATRNKRRLELIRLRQKQLVEEWGTGVTEGS